MQPWPIDIDDSEEIVRGIFSPYHINKNGTLKLQAFQPSHGTDEVSVMRLNWMGLDLCKRKAKEMERLNAKPPKTLITLACLSTEKVRKGGLEVLDSRKHFDGHADIKLGIIVPGREPLPPEQIIRLNEKIEYLIENVRLLLVNSKIQDEIVESIEEKYAETES
jgi:hypothetical protein